MGSVSPFFNLIPNEPFQPVTVLADAMGSVSSLTTLPKEPFPSVTVLADAAGSVSSSSSLAAPLHATGAVLYRPL